MPRLLPEEEGSVYDSSSEDNGYDAFEATRTSAKYTRARKESSSTSLQSEPTPNNTIEHKSQQKTPQSKPLASMTSTSRKREREDEDTTPRQDAKRSKHNDTCENCQWCQLAAFEDYEKYPIIITNEVDNVALPETFRFIQHSIYREGVEPAEDAFLTGCECEHPKDCEEKGCSCTEDVEKPPGTKIAAHKMQYQVGTGYRNCLKEGFLNQRQAIFECNDKCACGPSCKNRVVERGRKLPLEIFKTSDDRGWGLRCQKDILEGQFIDLYVGEVITAEEAQRRRQESEVEKRKDVYLFALDKFTDPDSYDERLRGPPLEVDGEFYSGPTRFMNHSCDPNCRIFARVGDSANKHLHDLAFFAIKPIPANTELIFDYVDGSKDEDPDEEEVLEGDKIRCRCGSKKCRGWLW